MNRFDSFTIAPLSAGDIIDRAIRLYRRHFMTLLRIVLVPSLIAYAGGIALTVGAQNLTLRRGDTRMILSLVLLVVGLGAYLIGKIGFFVVLGGTSRALVNHFIDGSPLRARDVYQAVRERFWSLAGATVLVVILLVAFFMMIYVIIFLTGLIYAFGAVWAASTLPMWAQVIFHAIFGGLLVTLFLALALMAYGRIVYVPQALMVEGKGVFNALSRSITLAGQNLRRIAAIFLFWFYVAFSVYLLLIIPLDWYAYLNGVDINPFSTQTPPLWYSISQQTLTQVSEILLAPIALLSFTVLYIDSRVRKEGFDIELFANRRLAAPSFTPPPIAQTAAAAISPVPSILGLNDYKGAPILHAQVEERPAMIEPSAESLPALGACQNCGTAARPDDLFCHQCGAAYVAEVEIEE